MQAMILRVFVLRWMCRCLFGLAGVGLTPTTIAQPKLAVTRLSATSVQLSWPGAEPGFQLEASSQLGAAANWQAVAPVPVLVAGQYSVTVQAGETPRFFRLRSAAAGLTSILETSPGSGESGVAVTRETIIRFSQPLAADTMLANDRMYAEFGGRRLLSRVELSSDRTTATLFYLENLPGSARVRVTFDGSGVTDFQGQLLDADGDGQPGGTLHLQFDTLTFTPVAQTAIIGRVFSCWMPLSSAKLMIRSWVACSEAQSARGARGVTALCKLRRNATTPWSVMSLAQGWVAFPKWAPF